MKIGLIAIFIIRNFDGSRETKKIFEKKNVPQKKIKKIKKDRFKYSNLGLFYFIGV